MKPIYILRGLFFAALLGAVLPGSRSAEPDRASAHTQIAPLVLLCLTENVTFAQWQRLFGSAPRAAMSLASSNEIREALDAVEILRAIAPQEKFALAEDPDLKLCALRDPRSRFKAMQLYGLDLSASGVLPDLGSLLHTRPGDNCPICRQRAQMERAASDF